MKTSKFFTAIGLITAVWFSACTNDEPMDPNALPEGKYPLEIASVTMSVESSSEPWSAGVPQTRVAENADGMSSTWEWDGTERIGVQLYADDDDVATYTLNADKTLTPDKTLYWKNKEQTTVMAWYPVETEVSLANQKDKLAYVLKGSGTGDYNNPVGLGFDHALAKIRVKLTGGKAGDVTDFKIKSFTSCTHTNGTDIQGSDEGWITMQQVADKGYWEANVVPYHSITKFLMNEKNEGTLNGNGITPLAAKVNTITISVEQAPIDLDTYEGTTLTVSGKIVIKGNGTQKDLQIIVEDGSDVTLQNVNLSHTGLAPIVCKGDASLTLAGSNTLAATSVAWDFKTGTGIYVESGTLTINAESGASLAINRNGGGLNQAYGAGIGVTENADLIINGGTIIVDNIASPSYECGAGIGGLNSETSGNITIAGGTITIGQPSWWSAGIGGGSIGNCKNITITGSSTVITVAKGIHNDYHIGCSTNGSVKGTITIGGGATVNGKKYTETHTGAL